jgi:hypothetical protein
VVWTETAHNPGFPEDDPSDGSVMASYALPGNAWSRARVVAERGVYASLRAGRYSDGGGADVVWGDTGDDGLFGLWHARLGHR